MEFYFITICSWCDNEMKREPLPEYWVKRHEEKGIERNEITNGICCDCEIKVRAGTWKKETKQ